MPAGTLLQGSNYLSPVSPQPSQYSVATFSDGYSAALWRFKSSGGAFTSYYATRTAAGVWGAPGSFGFDILGGTYATLLVGNTLYIVSQSGTTLSLYSIVWNATTHTATSVGPAQPATTNPNTVGTLDAWYNTSTATWYLACTNPTNGNPFITVLSSGWVVQQTVNQTGGAGPTGQNLLRLLASSATATTGYLVAGGTGSTISVWPVTLGTNTASFGTRETITASVSAGGGDCQFDASGNLDIVWNQSGTVLAIKRTGTNTYSNSVTLATGATSTAAALATAYNPTTGNLWVFYRTTANQPNGEIYAVPRQSGIWQAPFRVAGGDATGYAAPSTAQLFTTSTYDLLYTNGTAAGSYAAYDLTGTEGATPNTPVVTAPSGNVSGTTPTLTWTYSNSVAADTQGAWEAKVIRVSDSVVMWDSGAVSGAATSDVYGTNSNTSDGNYVAPATLVIGTQYSAQVRVKDSQLGNWSAYSAGVTFTPQVGPQASITSVTSPTGGTASAGAASSTLASNTLANATSLTVATGQGSRFTNGDSVAVGAAPNIDLVTISAITGDTLTVGAMTHAHSSADPVVQAQNSMTAGGATFDLVAEVQQASGHAISAYQITLYAQNGTTVIWQGSTTTLSPTVSPGSTFAVTGLAPTGITNNAVYQLAVTVTDGTTNVTAQSPFWQITTSYTPPNPPHSVSAIPSANDGWVTLTWTNDASATAVTVQRRTSATATAAAGPWVTLSSGSLITKLRDFPPVGVPVDYGFVGTSTAGTSSTVTASNVTLGMALGYLGFWLNSLTAPATTKCPLGPLESFSDTGLDHNIDAMTATIAGLPKPKKSFGAMSFWSSKTGKSASGRKHFVPQTDPLGPAAVTVTAVQVLAALDALDGTLALYRTPDGKSYIVEVSNYHRESADGFNTIVSFDVEEVTYSGLPPTA